MRRLLSFACLMALLLLLPLAASAAAAPKGPCRMIDPSTCGNGNELARANGFIQALGHYAGSEKASYFKSSRSLSEQTLAGLTGAAQNVVQLSDNRYLFSGCPSRECGGNATAVVLNEYGQILGIAFSSFHCETACDDYRHLDFYFRKGDQDDTVLAALKAWGTGDKLHQSQNRPDADDGIDKRMDVHLLP